MGLNKRLIDQAGGGGLTPTDSFDYTYYAGTGSSQSITGFDFEPDLVIIKINSTDYGALPWAWFDTVRGATQYIESSDFNPSNIKVVTDTNSLTSFDANGFTLGSADVVNAFTYGTPRYYAYAFKAGGSVSPNNNSDGTITSTVSANQESGFSIVKYTGNGSSNQSFGHGLSAAPEFVIIKNLGNNEPFSAYYGDSGKYMELGGASYYPGNDVIPISNANIFNSSHPTSTVFNIGNDVNSNSSGVSYTAYCFHSVDGLIKKGTFTGNAGTISITTGFEPRLIIIKSIQNDNDWWMMQPIENDMWRINVDDNFQSYFGNLVQNVTTTSTGFSFYSTWSGFNANGNDYMYLAIA